MVIMNIIKKVQNMKENGIIQWEMVMEKRNIEKGIFLNENKHGFEVYIWIDKSSIKRMAD